MVICIKKKLRKLVVILNLLTVVIDLEVYSLEEKIGLCFHHSIYYMLNKKM